MTLRVIFLLFIFTHHAFSAEGLSKSFKRLGFHGGTLTEFYDQVQVNEKGDTNKFEFNPLLGFSVDVEISPSWAIVPEIFWVLPREAGDGVTKNLFMFRADAAWRGGEWCRLRIGTSLMVNNIRGEGGTTEVENGDGQTKFYIPSESGTSVNNTLDLGAEGLFDTFGIRFQTYIYSLLKSERRQVSYTLTFTYYYDLGP